MDDVEQIHQIAANHYSDQMPLSMDITQDTLINVFQCLDEDSNGYITQDKLLNMLEYGGYDNGSSNEDLIMKLKSVIRNIPMDQCDKIYFDVFVKIIHQFSLEIATGVHDPADEHATVNACSSEISLCNSTQALEQYGNDTDNNSTEDSGVHSVSQAAESTLLNYCRDPDSESLISARSSSRQSDFIWSGSRCVDHESIPTDCEDDPELVVGLPPRPPHYPSPHQAHIRRNASGLSAKMKPTRTIYAPAMEPPSLTLDSPVSNGDLFTTGLTTNLEMLKEQMSRMEAQMDAVLSGGAPDLVGSGDGNRTSATAYTDSRYLTLRDQNQQLRTQIYLLEEAIRDHDVRSSRQLESERQISQMAVRRVVRDADEERENLRTRLQATEDEFSEAKVAGARHKLEAEQHIREVSIAGSMVEELEQRRQTAQEEMDRFREYAKREMDSVRRERDQAIQAVEELSLLNARRGEGGSKPSPCSPGHGQAQELANRLVELQEVARRLNRDNNAAREQLEEAQAELMARALEEGRQHVMFGGGSNGQGASSIAQEMDQLNTDDVRRMLAKERETNCQLRDYLNQLISRVLDNNPSLLEIDGAQN